MFNFMNFEAATSAVGDIQTKVSDISSTLEKIYPKLIDFGGKLLMAIIVYIIGSKIIKFAMKLSDKMMEKSKLDKGVQGFLKSVLKFLLYFVLLVVICGQVGIDTASVITLLGTAGLAFSLALQGSLSNFAGGILILVLKPFIVGDFINAQGFEGTVEKIDIFYTTLLTLDNRTVVLPNGTLSNGSIINVTREPMRRLDVKVPIDYSNDIKKATDVLTKVLEKEELRVKEKPVEVIVVEFGDDAIILEIHSWFLKENFVAYRSAVLTDVKKAFDENGLTIPFKQLVVHSSDEGVKVVNK
ncbi:MAG: mechanosensitive ion channel [Lachnospiraceae bacterium]|nr:mechanosensitive ion channel [Lachnospiraceae bacterium]